jgi:tungstate transport system substrate-binding protein
VAVAARLEPACNIAVISVTNSQANPRDAAARPRDALGMSSSTRRSFLQLSAGAAAASALATACRARDGGAPAPARTGALRVLSVPTAVEGALLPELVRDFGSQVEIEARPDVYDAARAGKADLVISHYGHHDCEQFVLEGKGEWPRTICSNQMALLGPASDPAGVRGLTDAALAMQRIAASQRPFVMNDLDGVRYLAEILWHAAGRPARDGWWLDERHQREDAIRVAASRGGYTLWGLTPFLRSQRQLALPIEPLVLADPLLQRMMVAVVVRVPGSDVDGARALQAHLLAPATQARIRVTRYPTDEHVCWVPAGRHNRTEILPKT